MHQQLLISALLTLPLTSFAAAQAPAFDCSKVAEGSIEALVCQTPDLSALDRQMAEVYQQASAKTGAPQPSQLKAEQRGWIKGRDECWKDDDKPRCVADSYRLRIAELQARYQLLPGKGPVVYVCQGQAGKDVTATFYPTEPATAVVEFAGSTSLMYQQQAASGARYAGSNESLWEHQGEARVVWGYDAPEMQCTVRQP